MCVCVGVSAAVREPSVLTVLFSHRRVVSQPMCFSLAVVRVCLSSCSSVWRVSVLGGHGFVLPGRQPIPGCMCRAVAQMMEWEEALI